MTPPVWSHHGFHNHYILKFLILVSEYWYINNLTAKVSIAFLPSFLLSFCQSYPMHNCMYQLAVYSLLLFSQQVSMYITFITFYNSFSLLVIESTWYGTITNRIHPTWVTTAKLPSKISSLEKNQESQHADFPFSLLSALFAKKCVSRNLQRRKV